MTGYTSTGRRGWVGVARRWLADPTLSDRALRLMLWLDSHTDDYLRDLNTDRIARELGWSRNTVTARLEELAGHGLIATTQVPHPDSGGTRTLVTLHQDAWTAQGVDIPRQQLSSAPKSPVNDCRATPVSNCAASTSTTTGSRAPDAVSTSDVFTREQVVKAAEKLRNDTPTKRQHIIDMRKAQRLTNLTPQPPIEAVALALLGEEASLIRWEHDQTQAQKVGEEIEPLTREQRDALIEASRKADV